MVYSSGTCIKYEEGTRMFSKSIPIFLLSIVVFVPITTLAQTSDDVLWEKACDGNIPIKSVIGGKEADGTNLYMARAIYKDGLHPGKVRKEFKAANIPWGGKEIQVKCYEVFVGNGKWQRAKNGNIPPEAIIAGHEKDGTPLYSARAKYRGGIHPGKVRKEFRAANISWGGSEIQINSYEVLTKSDFPPELPSKIPTNAQIINSDVNLRDTYSNFSWKTLFTFQLRQGNVIDIIKEGTRVNVIGRSRVSNKFEWFEVIYLRNSDVKRGWVYGGEKNNIRYIKFDTEVEKREIPTVSEYKYELNQIVISVLNCFSSNLALAGQKVANDTNPTNPISTLLLSVCYVIIFVCSLFSVKRWIFSDSNFYCFVTSLSIMVILGFLSSTIFSDIISRILA